MSFLPFSLSVSDDADDDDDDNGDNGVLKREGLIGLLVVCLRVWFFFFLFSFL